MKKEQALPIALDMLLGALFDNNLEAERAWRKAHEHLTLEQQVEQAKNDCNL